MKHKRNAARDAGKLQANYANYFEVGFNAVEFVIDFGQFYEGTEEAELYSRIITNPIYAKEFLKTLQESIYRFEQDFGSIQEDK